VTLDVVDAVQPESAWEIVAQVSLADRDVERTVCGYGWGTLLSGAQAVAVGGSEALREVPGAELLQGPGGHVWVWLGDDPASVDRDDVAALRCVLAPVLAPVLPGGRRTVEEYDAPRSNLCETPPLPYVVRVFGPAARGAPAPRLAPEGAAEAASSGDAERRHPLRCRAWCC
jgi:hypothetical protein